jgi:intron-binding protein aquarius
MAPRTRGKDDAAQGTSDASQIAVNLDEESIFTQLAKKHWLKSSKSTKVKVKPDVLKSEVWDVLEKEDFAFRLLLELENLQILDR